MYGASEAQVKLENGGEFTLVQSTDYPFDGAIRFTAKNVKVNAPVHLRLRVPGWAAGGSHQGRWRRPRADSSRCRHLSGYSRGGSTEYGCTAESGYEDPLYSC